MLHRPCRTGRTARQRRGRPLRARPRRTGRKRRARRGGSRRSALTARVGEKTNRVEQVLGTVVSDARGAYRLRLAQGGIVRILAVGGGWVNAKAAEEAFEWRSDRAWRTQRKVGRWVSHDVHVLPTGRVVGRVLHEDGRPAEGTRLRPQRRRVDPATQPSAYPWFAVPDAVCGRGRVLRVRRPAPCEPPAAGSVPTRPSGSPCRPARRRPRRDDDGRDPTGAATHRAPPRRRCRDGRADRGRRGPRLVDGTRVRADRSDVLDKPPPRSSGTSPPTCRAWLCCSAPPPMPSRSRSVPPTTCRSTRDRMRGTAC